MVAKQGKVEVPVQQVVVCRQVVGPEELLSAQFDGVRHEEEEGHPHRHLYQGGQASAHGAHAILAVELHGLLLLLQGILGIGILVVDLVDVGLECTHLGSREVLLVGEGEYDGLHDEREQKEHDTHVHTP